MTDVIGLLYENELRTREAEPISTAPKERVLLWRADEKLWEVGMVEPKYFGNSHYAYTHWAPLPHPPR
jgi:hypothetical protein